jgi:hypothetical protein
MILGGDKQNKNLSDAASKRIDTSPRTRTSNALAGRIATQKNNTSIAADSRNNVATSSRRMLSEAPPDPLRGSYEGLVKQSAGHIQMDGDGYDNPDFQKARYEKNSLKSGEIKQQTTNKLSNSSSSIKNNDIINNYSSAFNGNNIANRMTEFIKTDNMFR